MSGQDDIELALASVVLNSARACRDAFDSWIAQPGQLRREKLEGLMRGHELDVIAALQRENLELKAQLEALRGERDRVVRRLAAKPKLRLAAPDASGDSA